VRGNKKEERRKGMGKTKKRERGSKGSEREGEKLREKGGRDSANK
jgi:hypothetical protein